MAIYKQLCYGNEWDGPTSHEGDAASAEEFFRSLNCPLIDTELIDAYTFSINIDNTILLELEEKNTKWVTSTYNEETEIIGGIEDNRCKYFTVVYSNDFLFISYLDAYPNWWFLYYEKIGNNKYYGHESHGNTPPEDKHGCISVVDLIKLGTEEIYKHGANLNYYTNVDCIDYMSEDVLFDSEDKKTTIKDPNCIAITNSELNKIITINGHNYYTLSTNVAIQLDDQ